MSIISIFLVCLVALEHLYFLFLEMFLWTKPKGIKTFGLKSKAFAEETKVLAANQGLYNGFLAAGLIFSLVNNDTKTILFSLGCITVAGIFAAVDAITIAFFYVQSLPSVFPLSSILI